MVFNEPFKKKNLFLNVGQSISFRGLLNPFFKKDSKKTKAPILDDSGTVVVLLRPESKTMGKYSNVLR
jgi:hypothetical protein